MSNSVGRNDNFLAKAQKLSILPTSSDVFDIRQHYIRILYLHHKQKRNKAITQSLPARRMPLHVNTAFRLPPNLCRLWRESESQEVHLQWLLQPVKRLVE